MCTLMTVRWAARTRLLLPLLLFFFLTLSPDALAQAGSRSLNMTLLGHFNPDTSGGLHSACWGYAAPDGREYALLGIQEGTSFVDITADPIREVAFLRGPKSNWREMKTWGTYAYIVTESRDSGNGLQIVDLSTLPDSVRLVRTDSTNFTTAHTVNVSDHYLFAMGTQAEAGANGGAIIMDLLPDPTRPRKVGAVTPYYFHDAFIRNDTLLGAAIGGQGCDLYDISDKQNPRRITNISYPYSGTHNAELTQDGRYVVTTDEVNFTPKTLKIWDISDPDEVAKVADFTPSPGDVVHNVHIRGRYAIVAWYTAGVRIIDLIDPRHPREVGFYDTFDEPGGGFLGVWEAYGFYPSGRLIAFDRTFGLYVLRFNNATAGSVSGTVRNSQTGDPLAGVKLVISGRTAPITTDAAGGYYIGAVNGEPLTIEASQFGYEGRTLTARVDGDQTLDIELDPVPFYRSTVRVVTDKGDTLQEFNYAIRGLLPSTRSTAGGAFLLLPRGDTFQLTVGAWGYRTKAAPIAIDHNGEEFVVMVARGYYDNATLDLGWSYASDSDAARTGTWVRIVPYLGYIGSNWIHPPTEPSGDPYGSIFVTGTPPVAAPPQLGDVNNGTTTLTTPVMDLTGHVDPEIRFDLWYVQYRHDSLDLDSLRIDLSNDGGSTWTTTYVEGDGREGWNAVSFRPGLLMPLTDRMMVRFRASDARGVSLVNCAVDNFEVTGGPTSTPNDAEPRPPLVMSAFPNPVRNESTLVIKSPERMAGAVIELFDIEGRRRAAIYNGPIESGTTQIAFGQSLPTGVYSVVLRSSANRRKCLLLTIIH